MPLTRVEVRNEYGLGAREMYMEANNDEPHEILQGVVVAGLVGVLRQLGDLANFAAEVFHNLQEEVTIACSRSYKLMGRVEQIEAALFPVEKTSLAQQSHVHFAYSSGVNWRAPVRCERNHFVYSEMPPFILDSYQDCRSPPHLHLLDRFDPGGPGSCLRRYSDPTIFINASETSGDLSQQVARAMQARKSEKLRSRPRKEVSQGALFAYRGARMQFPQSNASGFTSSHQPISTLKPDFYEQSTSDQRHKPSCSEDDICPTYSVQTKEQESRGFISPPKKSHGSDDQDHDFLKEKVTNECDYNVNEVQGVCSSYSDTWGEKTAEPEKEDYDHDDLETLADDSYNYKSADKLDVQTCNQNFQTLESGAIHHLKGFEGETDHFMYAPTIFKPESGPRMDCMRKLNVDHFFELVDKAATDRLPENINQNLNSQASISEHIPFPEFCSPGCCSSGRVLARDENSISSAGKSSLTSQITRDTLRTSSKKSINENGGIVDSTNTEFISCGVSSNFRNNGSGMPVIGDTKRSYDEPEKHLKTSYVTSVTLRTGLAGLQPSKPPLCSVLNDLPKEDWKSSAAQHVLFHDRESQKPDETNSCLNIGEALDIDYFTRQEFQENDESSREKFWKRDNLLHPHDASSTGASVSASGSSLSVNSDFQAARKFELRSKMVSTSSYEEQFHGGEEISSRASYMNTNDFEHIKHQNLSYQTFPGQTEHLSEGGSLMKREPASPLLSHMEMSVQQMGGFNTSKLKLKFVNGNIIDPGTIDVFPSFQVVPEVSNNVGSDSDDDTFCRSSPSLAHGLNDHRSDSNSEQWESRRPLDIELPDLYDSICRISLAERASEVQEKWGNCLGDIQENRDFQFSSVENSMQSSCSQSLRIQNQSFEKEFKKDTNSKDLLEPEFAAADPPPLPPVQWWAMKPHLDPNKKSCGAMPASINSAIDLKHSTSSSSQQHNPVPIYHDQNLDTANEQKNKPYSSEKSNEAEQGKNIDQNSFLNQIRRQSLSLRPTLSTKPVVPSRSSTNVQFMTILEKANAIRQAVGSDDGDSGTDT